MVRDQPDIDILKIKGKIEILMMKSIILIALVLSTCIFRSKASALADTLNVPPFGKVFIYRQSSSPGKVAIMISGDGGWKYGVVDFAESFSRENILVIGVDILKYIKALKQIPGECIELAADFINLASVVEKEYDFPKFTAPVIMGYSSGATMVYAVLAQADTGTFAGGISLGFCSDLLLPRSPCRGNGLIAEADSTGKIFFLQPNARLANRWIVLHGKVDKVCNYSQTVEFIKKTSGAELITLPDVGHGFTKQNSFMPQWKDAFKRLTE
jgi:type IV secretory pathway VirJ component